MDQNSYAPILAPQPCPVCDAPPQERQWRVFEPPEYTKIRSEKHRFIGSPVTPLVCTRCGFVQLFVDPSDFRKDAAP